MGLLSFLRKSKQHSADDNSAAYVSRTEEQPAGTARGRKRRSGGDGSDPADPVLPEKKRARRRLVGAIALVLAAIIGLPMLMDPAPKPLADDIAIQIPSKDKPAQPENQRRAVPADRPGVAVAAALDKNEEVITPPAAAPKPAAPVAVSSAETKPQAANQSKAEPKSESKPVAKVAAQPQPAEKRDDPARAQAILEGKSDAPADKQKQSEVKAGKFVIQVAALASQQKVNEVQGKLKGAGIKSYTQKVATQSGERIRIRVGPFSSKEEAEKVRAKIGQLGLNGTLVPA